MYKIAVSPEELNAFGQSVDKFKNGVLLECENLQQQTKAISECVDNATVFVLTRPIQEVTRIISDKEEALKKLAENAYAYAGKLRLIQQRIEQEKGNKSTLREKAAGVATGALMQQRIREVDQGYQTAGASSLKTAASGMVSAISHLSGVKLDASEIDNAMDSLVRFADGQAAIKYPEKRIDRSATKIPQEQLDSHTLVINDPSDPWGTTK